MATPSVGENPANKEEREDYVVSSVEDSDGFDEGSLSDGTAFTQSTRTTVKQKGLETKESQGEATVHQGLLCLLCKSRYS